jgi:hypothetical protein
LPDEVALAAAVVYVVKKQPNPLAVWFHPQWQAMLDAYDRNQHSAD